MFNAKINILLIEDEDYDVRRIRNTLKPFEDHIHIMNVVSDGSSVIDLLRQNKDYDVVIMDFQISGILKGETLIREIKKIDPTIQIIVVTKMTTNATDFNFANKLLEAGAMWYCTKYPGDIEEFIYQPTDFVLSIYNAYERRKLEKEKQRSTNRLKKNIQQMLDKKQIIGLSPPIVKLREHIEYCARTNANVLILGASGTGKELVAYHIHYKSARNLENFVPINCSSLPEHLIESELFGFAKGSFTGATSPKKGLFELADKGTIFLDEIADLPLTAQAKLLRVIDEGEIDKIGRVEKINVDVRVVAATNKNLEKEVRENRFREDLFYRLNVVSIHVPPLKERKEDIPILVSHFMNLFSRDTNQQQPLIKDEAMQVLVNFDWPGNVRQLQNVVQRLLFMHEPVIGPSLAKFALGIQEGEPPSHSNSLEEFWSKNNILTWREMETIIKKKYFYFVRQNAKSDSEAASLLGLAPPNYHRMCKKLGLK